MGKFGLRGAGVHAVNQTVSEKKKIKISLVIRILYGLYCSLNYSAADPIPFLNCQSLKFKNAKL
jgi:hypothetical protein